mmetsp:Transcript_14989/g.32309  ORF Transcript_14989/g.32309 Transcript_14989/m.32309 type:complete len:286 (+) Transcript_14989:1720-2577(+)
MIDIPQQRSQTRDRPCKPNSPLRILKLDIFTLFRRHGHIPIRLVNAGTLAQCRQTQQRPTAIKHIGWGRITLPPLLPRQKLEKRYGVVSGDSAQELGSACHALQCRANAARDHAHFGDDAAGKCDGCKHQLVVYQNFIADDAPQQPYLKKVEDSGDGDRADGPYRKGLVRCGQLRTPVCPRHNPGSRRVEYRDQSPKRRSDASLRIGPVVGPQIIIKLVILIGQTPIIESKRKEYGPEQNAKNTQSDRHQKEVGRFGNIHAPHAHNLSNNEHQQQTPHLGRTRIQ